MTEYSVYNPVELVDRFNNLTEQSDEVNKFFTNFKFSTIINQNNIKNNSVNVFKNIIKEDTTKSKIVGLLNKLNQQNISKIITGIREIVFQTEEELYELVTQCMQKIKRDSDQVRPLVAALCWELQTTYFITIEGEKIYFRKLLLSEIKKEYLLSISYDNEDWNKEKGEKIMILIGTMFNNKIIESKIMSSIINDFKNLIKYKEDSSQEYYEKVEKCINQLSCLVSCIINNDEAKKIYDNLDKFLEKENEIYEEKRCIQKKTRLICKNIIYELRK
jgi:hypothetical protein